MKTMASRWGWFVVALAATACGGVVSSPGDDGGTGNDGSPGSDGGGGSACPKSPPTAGAACTPVDLRCEYGTNPNPSCNQIFACTPSGWVDQTSGSACPAGQCPATYASVPSGQDCSPESLTCAYPEGECICTRSFGGPQMLTPKWDCIPATDGCPSPRPDIGTSCSQAGLDCNYGACSGGVDLVCKDGRWQQQIIPCPL